MEQAWCGGLSEASEQRGSIERAPGSGLPRTMSGGVVCRPVSTLNAYILNITYMIAALKITMS